MEKQIDQNGEIVMGITDMKVSELVQLIVEGEIGYVSIGRRKSDGAFLTTIGAIPEGRLYCSEPSTDALVYGTLELLYFLRTERPRAIAERIREQQRSYTGGQTNARGPSKSGYLPNLHSSPPDYPF